MLPALFVCESGVVRLQAGRPGLWPLLQAGGGELSSMAWLSGAWAHLSSGASPPIPARHLGPGAAWMPVCFVTQPSSWRWGDAALLGVAVKLFTGEVGAGNEAKAQPWPRRRGNAMTIIKQTDLSGHVARVWAAG